MTRLSLQLRKKLFCLLLTLVTLATFWPVIHNGFIEYDDDEYIFENPTVRAGWSAPGFVWAFMGYHCANYHPLAWLSHMTDCQFFGVNAGAHHLMNVLIHCANAVLLLWLLDLLTGKFWRSAFVAAVFALHPLRVESVAWAAERKDVLCAFFFLLTLLAYVKCVRRHAGNMMREACSVNTVGRDVEDSRITPHASPARPRLALIFYLLALLAKPMAVTLPVILLLLDFWPLGRIAGNKLKVKGSPSQNLQPSTFNIQLHEKWPFFFLSIVFGATTVFAQHNLLPKQPTTLFTRLEHLTADLFGYVEKILWPQDLSFLYLRPEHISTFHLLTATLLLLGISIFAGFNWRRRPWLLAGWLWFLVMLLPVTAVTLNKLSIADRYTYLPGIGFCVLLVWGTAEVGEKFFVRLVGKIIAVTVAFTILFFCAVQTRQQIGYWKNTQTLMERALQLDPNNDVAAQILRIYRFEQEHPGVRENHSHGNSGSQTPR